MNHFFPLFLYIVKVPTRPSWFKVALFLQLKKKVNPRLCNSTRIRVPSQSSDIVSSVLVLSREPYMSVSRTPLFTTDGPWLSPGEGMFRFQQNALLVEIGLCCVNKVSGSIMKTCRAKFSSPMLLSRANVGSVSKVTRKAWSLFINSDDPVFWIPYPKALGRVRVLVKNHWGRVGLPQEWPVKSTGEISILHGKQVV